MKIKRKNEKTNRKTVKILIYKGYSLLFVPKIENNFHFKMEKVKKQKSFEIKQIFIDK